MESFSFLKVFLKKKSCHLRNSTLRPFLRQTNATIAFRRPKNLGLEVFVTNGGASTSRQTTRQSSGRTTNMLPQTTAGCLEVEDDKSTATSAARCHFQPMTCCHVSS
ncbi:hypothetical protein MTR_7g034735 [Medicago truncatula]|uniref:Uncharacterized protein n=1 Tax=Medicago truncatula TaxID=3880 RepID=A0A072U8R5_MEDTR|nr:hypothetical protein MTR_7g034735 [Medicago truncatula]